MAETTVYFRPDTADVIRTARIIAKHLTALADELEQPDMVIRRKS